MRRHTRGTFKRDMPNPESTVYHHAGIYPAIEHYKAAVAYKASVAAICRPIRDLCNVIQVGGRARARALAVYRSLSTCKNSYLRSIDDSFICLHRRQLIPSI